MQKASSVLLAGELTELVKEREIKEEKKINKGVCVEKDEKKGQDLFGYSSNQNDKQSCDIKPSVSVKLWEM